MKTFFSIVLLLQLLSISAFGQYRFIFELSGNKPFIPTIINANNIIEIPFPSTGGVFSTNSVEVHESYKTKPGFSLKFGVERKIIKKLDINALLEFSILSFERESYLHSNQTLTVFSNIETINSKYSRTTDHTGVHLDHPFDEKIKTLYITLPINIKYEVFVERFAIETGLLSSILIHSNQQIPYEYIGPADEKNYGLSKLLWGIRLGMQYRMYNNIWITSEYQPTITPIYKEQSRIAGDAKYQMVKLGLKYYIK